MKSLIKFLIFSLFFICISVQINAQVKTKTFGIAARISIQSDFQKADFKDSKFPFEFKEHTATELNFGIDLLGEKQILNKWSVSLGIGYFRNRFNFKRDYDHQLLNIGSDSFPIGTSTNNYTFRLLRFPIGVYYHFPTKNKYNLILGLENVFNFSFQQIYNGRKAFPEATNKYTGISYYGNSVLLYGGLSSFIFRSSVLQLEPYVRLLNIYKRKDPFLYENNAKPYFRTFDGIGLSLKCTTNFKH